VHFGGPGSKGALKRFVSSVLAEGAYSYYNFAKKNKECQKTINYYLELKIIITGL
jgi:hypothetical protein